MSQLPRQKVGRELAEALEIPPGTVKSRLFRARKLLKAQMDKTPLAPELQRSVQAQFGHWVREEGDGPNPPPKPER